MKYPHLSLWTWGGTWKGFLGRLPCPLPLFGPPFPFALPSGIRNRWLNMFPAFWWRLHLVCSCSARGNNVRKRDTCIRPLVACFCRMLGFSNSGQSTPWAYKSAACALLSSSNSPLPPSFVGSVRGSIGGSKAHAAECLPAVFSPKSNRCQSWCWCILE